jgi:hypothetical protein
MRCGGPRGSGRAMAFGFGWSAGEDVSRLVGGFVGFFEVAGRWA